MAKSARKVVVEQQKDLEGNSGAITKIRRVGPARENQVACVRETRVQLRRGQLMYNYGGNSPMRCRGETKLGSTGN